MSNGLYVILLTLKVPDSNPGVAGEHPVITNWIAWFFAVGLCTLVVWIIRRWANPQKLTLRNTPGRPNKLNPLHILLIFLIMYAVQGTVVPLLKTWYRLEPPRGILIAGLLAQVACLVAVLVTASATFAHGLRRGFGLSLRHWIYDSARAVIGYFAIIPVCLSLLWVCQWLIPGEKPPHQMLVALLELSGPWRVMIVISAVILAPLSEEMLFRGLLQSMLRRYFGRPWIAITITSVAFAMSHYPYWHTMPALIALSVAMGYNYERCGRLYPAIVIHSIFNAVNIAWALTSG